MAYVASRVASSCNAFAIATFSSLSVHSVDGNQFGGSVAGKASTIGIQISPTL